VYTDPGILSMIIAAIVGSVIAIPTYIFLLRKKIGGWFNARRKQNNKRSGEL